MKPGATTAPATSIVWRASGTGSSVTDTMRPSSIATLRTASSPVAGSTTRPPVRTRSGIRLWCAMSGAGGEFGTTELYELGHTSSHGGRRVRRRGEDRRTRHPHPDDAVADAVGDHRRRRGHQVREPAIHGLLQGAR